MLTKVSAALTYQTANGYMAKLMPVRRRLFVYLICVSLLNLLALIVFWFWTRISSVYLRWSLELIGVEANGSTSTPHLLCIFTTFKPKLQKLEVNLHLFNSTRNARHHICRNFVSVKKFSTKLQLLSCACMYTWARRQ